jgi:hypothetical protein
MRECQVSFVRPKSREPAQQIFGETSDCRAKLPIVVLKADMSAQGAWAGLRAPDGFDVSPDRQQTDDNGKYGECGGHGVDFSSRTATLSGSNRCKALARFCANCL